MKSKPSPILVLLTIVLLTALAPGGLRPALAEPPPADLYEPELLASVPSIGSVEAIHARDAAPNEILFAVQNRGASCGGGTPATIWKVILDPGTGNVIGVEEKQDLDQIQNTRQTLFESASGDLFTGGGWCDYKPPYRSTDGGETWQSADAGPVYPPNSTFSFVEFKGEIYAGTGYEPYHGQVYRWLGSGNWELVLDIAPPRSIVGTMVTYQDQLFVGSMIYGWDGKGCEASMPVYVSSDGNVFDVTSGIPSCYQTPKLMVINDQLVAWTHAYDDRAQKFVYRWNGSEWEQVGKLGLVDFSFYIPPVVSDDGTIYLAMSSGIYGSTDFGLTWEQVAVLDGPRVYSLDIHDDTLYLGTQGDAGNTGYIYRIQLNPPAELAPSLGDEEIYPGDTFTVDLNIVGANDLYAAQASCAVDPTILEIQDAVLGDFFANPLIGINEIDGAAGTWFAGLSLQYPAEPLSGDGHLATLTYQALTHGETALTCEPLFPDRDGFELPVIAHDAAIVVLEYGAVGGIATYQGRLDHAEIAVTATGPASMIASTDDEGHFEIAQLRHGSYTIQADASRYLCRATAVEIAGGPVALPDTVLLGGDANDDEEINIGDATMVAANFGLTVPPADANADINGDGVVNIQDLAILGGNFGRVGCLDW